ncbi:TetR/AcrR family transcriptional regulator [Burkholderia metallica]|uniref:TetR/AcrR family transcriptional regulator n=1 Tax=Burkholderia metallica TaxID=488729 RepID=UPI00157B5C40|nr:TetR/AcrR family transcriptional regulator [Burkholderia metallica]NTZ86851.1 TetR/AcrR family transcriptional regulator [Burkholderia metallica]
MASSRSSGDAEITSRRSQAERSHATRERVIAATIGLLHTEGYAGTTTRAVQKAAAVSIGALQHQFPTKAMLMAAVQERLIQERLKHVKAAAQDAANPLALVGRLLDFAGSLIGTPLFAASIEIDLARRSDKELDQAIAEVRDRSSDEFIKVTNTVSESAGDDARERVRELDLLTGALIRGLTVEAVTEGDLTEVAAAFGTWRSIVLQLLGNAMASPTHAAPGNAAPRRCAD